MPLKRPPAHLLRKARADTAEMRKDTVRTYLQNGWSLTICCLDCPRIVQWTPPELERRLADKLDASIADIAARAVCAPPEGCGSHDIALYPEPYHKPWTWPQP